MNINNLTDCRQLWREYPGRGRIKVMAETNGGTSPLPGALVSVGIVYNEQFCLLGEETANISGIAEFNELPAPAADSSLIPAGEHGGLFYTVKVSHIYLGERTAVLPVFGGIKTVWKVYPLPDVINRGRSL